MTKAEALWKKLHIKVGVDSWEVIVKDEFLAALHEYGAEVRKADVTKCRSFSHRRDDMGAIIAAEIEQEPLP